MCYAEAATRIPTSSTQAHSTHTPTTPATTSCWTKVPSKSPKVTPATGRVEKTPLPTTTITRKVAKSPPPTTGWLKADKSQYKIKKLYKCDKCGLKLDSVWNLRTHSNSKRCREAQPPSPPVFNSPPLDLEPYIIRNRPFRREIVDLNEPDETILAVSPVASYSINNVDLDETVLPVAQVEETIIPAAQPETARINQFFCGNCDTVFPTLMLLYCHRRDCHPDNLPAIDNLVNNFNSGFESETCKLEPVTTALNGFYRSITIVPQVQCLTADQLMLATQDGIRRVLIHILEHGDNVKVFATTSVTMQKINITDGSVEKEDDCFFSNRAIPIHSIRDIVDFIDTVAMKLQEDIDKYTAHGSNWIVKTINHIAIRLVRYNVFKGGANQFVLPPELAHKHSLLNIEVESEECLKYAIIASLHHTEVDQYHKNRSAQYQQFIQRYNFTGVTFPASVEDIMRFQINNKNIAVNALMYIEAVKDHPAKIVPLYHPPLGIVKDRRLATILLVKDHWLPITNLNRLLSHGHDHNAHCYRCLKNCYYPDRLEIHLTKCFNTLGQMTTMPAADNNYKKFDDWNKMQSPPFVMYADIEAILEKPDNTQKILQTHVPCAVGSYLVPHKDLNFPAQDVVFHQEADCVDKFCVYLEEKARELYIYGKRLCNKPQNRTQLEELIFEAASNCEYCKVSFNYEQKVWHHCHISGKLIAAVCQRCNTKIHQSITCLPVFFHNLKNYDMHSLCIAGLSKRKSWHLKPIAQTKEKYMTLTAKFQVDKDAANNPIFYEIRFIDTFQFLTSSLDRLSSTLKHDDMKHTLLLRDSYQLDDDVLFSKGIFPYSYLDSDDKLDDGQLPPIAEFFDSLRNQLVVTDAEYARAQKAWIQFQCFSFNDYLLRYLEVDCRLLADVFENFRATIIDDHELDPANFFTLPQLTFAAAFRYGECHLLTDEDQYEFFETGIRGGMTFVNTHHVKASPQVSISYWDENNLYGNALRQLLPTSGFQWLTEEEIAALDWHSIATDGEFGYTLMVDLEYPREIHDKTQDFPLAPEAKHITEDMLTPFMLEQWAARCEMRGYSTAFRPEKKLLMTCQNKKEYVVHFKLLKFYLEMGMKISKIHRVIKYRQTNIFCKYIDDNSHKRQAATNDFTKDLYKLLNNALFGKTMENVRGRKDYKLRNTEQGGRKDTSKPQYIRTHKFSDDLLLNELLKLEVKLDKPIFIGQAVLDLSKLIMYELRYKTLTSYEQEFNGRIEVIGGDTDSLFCKITNIDLHNVLHPAMKRDGLLDTSNYPLNHTLFSNNCKAKLGCIKDEVEGEKIVEAVLLKPKCYSMMTESGLNNKKTAKGVQYCVRQALAHSTYLETYQRQLEIVRDTRRFQTKDHVVSTILQRKWALSAADNKRAWTAVNESLPYGHYQLTDVPTAAKRSRLQ